MFRRQREEILRVVKLIHDHPTSSVSDKLYRCLGGHLEMLTFMCRP